MGKKQILRHKFGGYLSFRASKKVTLTESVDQNEEEEEFFSTEVISELSGYPFQRKVEAAGERYQYILHCLVNNAFILDSYQQLQELQQQEEEEDEEISEQDRKKFEQKRHAQTGSDTAATARQRSKRNAKKAGEKGADIDEDDPYQVMGLSHLRWRATEEDIKQAYRKLVLKFHPDKNEGIDDTIFKKIQTAHGILSDPQKRKVLDSEEDFDDWIPTGREKGDFFEIFGPVFARYSKWSVDPEVPLLGDMATPYKDVMKFYKFWYSFKSWRDYSFVDEYDPNEAETRDERRWMERQNDRERKKKKKEESQKIFQLTETAEKLDPRIKQQKDAERQEREKKKQAKEDIIKKKQEEVARLAALEKAKKEEEERKKKEELALAQKQQTLEIKRREKLRNSLRSLSVPLSPSDVDVENLCARLPNERLTELVSVLEKRNLEESKKAFTAALEALKKEDKEKEEAKQKSAKPGEVTKAWTDDELALLSQAVARFPGGVTDRWQKVSDYIGTRSVKEVIAKTKETKFVSSKPVVEDAFQRFTKTKRKTDKEITEEISISVEAPKPDVTTEQKPKEVEWTVADQKALEKALQAHPSTLTDRWDRIAKDVPGKTKKDCIQRYKFIVAQIKQKKTG